MPLIQDRSDLLKGWWRRSGLSSRVCWCCGGTSVLFLTQGWIPPLNQHVYHLHWTRLNVNHELYDSWRCLNTNERDYSFFSHRHRSYNRINLFLVDKWLLFKCRTVKINNITWSDHASLKLIVGDNTTHNPTFIWRTNPRLFQDAPTKSWIEG